MAAVRGSFYRITEQPEQRKESETVIDSRKPVLDFSLSWNPLKKKKKKKKKREESPDGCAPQRVACPRSKKERRGSKKKSPAPSSQQLAGLEGG